jgi:NAD(P)-dependent dehydrogenase (short-subunit alcohol dehydrogenase family)
LCAQVYELRKPTAPEDGLAFYKSYADEANGALMPEKSLRDLSAEKFHRIFSVNIIAPELIAKYFLPKLNKARPSIFTALSARVGSISDNYLGGWYAYRASKAALKMQPSKPEDSTSKRFALVFILAR